MTDLTDKLADVIGKNVSQSPRGIAHAIIAALPGMVKPLEWARGVAVIVSGDVTRLEPGADHSDMVRRVASAQNVHHVRQAKRQAARSR